MIAHTAIVMEEDEKNDKLKRDLQLADENLRRLAYLDRLNKKPLSKEEEEIERQKSLGLSGHNTFISYEDLEKMAQEGKTFFIPPYSGEDACLSCGNGHFYKGSLSDVRQQLESDLKMDPDNQQLKTGLQRIELEMIARPDLISNNKGGVSTEREISIQENSSNTPNPLSTKPK